MMGEWKHEVQHGPDGQGDYSWIYENDRMVCVCKTGDAIEIVTALNRPDPAAFMEEVREVAKKWMAYDELLRSIGDTIDADTLYKGVGPKVDAAYDDCVVATCNLLEKMEGK